MEALFDQLFVSVEATIYFTIALLCFVLLASTVILGELFEAFEGAGDWIEGLFGGADIDIDVSGDVDFGAGIDGPSYPSPFSSRILFAGLVGFGAGGWLGATQFGWSGLPNAGLAMAGFMVLTIVVYFLIALPMHRMEGNNVIDAHSFVGLTGQVTAVIPDTGGIGRVSLIAPGSGANVERSAQSETGGEIPYGTPVEIVEVGPVIVVVRPVTSK